MKKNILKIAAVLGLVSVVFNSCGPKENTPLVYFPDMYYPVSYDPLMKAEDPYTDIDNELPVFNKNNGATGMTPVDGTVARDKDGVVNVNSAKALTPDEYNAGYETSKGVTVSPLNPKNAEKDIALGKIQYEKTCGACHGKAGDGQGSIVVSGAYSGVPNYKDRELTVGTVHYVLTYGKNAMGSYAGQLTPGDRWRVAMYIMSEFKGAGKPKTDSAPKVEEEKTENKEEKTEN